MIYTPLYIFHIQLNTTKEKSVTFNHIGQFFFKKTKNVSKENNISIINHIRQIKIQIFVIIAKGFIISAA